MSALPPVLTLNNDNRVSVAAVERNKTARPIGESDPIRLGTAALVCFPDGSVTVATLRKEIADGRLTAWRVGGKHMTSVAEISRMLERCRVKPKDPIYGGENRGLPHPGDPPSGASGSSSTAAAIRAQDALRARLRKPDASSMNTSSPRMKRPGGSDQSLTSP